MNSVTSAAQSHTLAIRSVERSDADLIHALIGELADFEKLRHEVVATPQDIAAALFDPNPRAFCVIAELNGEAVGFALWFYNYSTFRGRHGIYLEDLFVRPAFRGHGIGRALLAHLAQRCIDEGLPRLQWQVLDWNRKAIDFYESLGAQLTPEWIGCRIESAVIAGLAASGQEPAR